MRPEDWIPIVISVIALGASGIGIWLGKEANRLSRQANDIAQRTYEADNVPNVMVETRSAADFSGVMTLLAGDNYVAQPPPPFEPPTALFLVNVKNEGKLPVAIANAGIRLNRTGSFIAFARIPANENHPFPRLPVDLAGGQKIEIPIAMQAIKQMLLGLEAAAEDTFSVQVSDAIDRMYCSAPLDALVYLQGGPMNVTVHLPNLLT